VALCATLAGRFISNFRFCIFKRSPLENLLHAQQIRKKRGLSREFKFNWVVLHNSYINVCGLTRCRRAKIFLFGVLRDARFGIAVTYAAWSRRMHWR
jgi:hypothetical protein